MKFFFVIIIILAGILVTVWFRDGLVMGAGEDSLRFYNISHFLPESQFAWMEHPGLGRVTIGLTATRPSYEMLAFLQRLGLADYLMQAAAFWFVLSSAGIGVYLLVREFFPHLPNKYVFISVLFYWFNPLSLVNVWNRFLTDYIFAFGLLPIAAFLFSRGLNRKNYLWSFILILILPVFGLAFTFIAFDILLWIFFFILILLFCLTHKEIKVRLFFVKYFLLTFLLFLFTNFWWISQLVSLNLFHNINSSVLNFDVSANLGTLDNLSKKLGNLSDILRLTNASFISERSLSWVKIYNLPPFSAVHFLLTGLILYSIVKFLKNKQALHDRRLVIIAGGLFLISVFLAKGTNPPFGEIYKFIFASIPFLQVFRNPFEKASFILSLSVSLMIGFGIYSLSKQYSKNISNLIYFLLLGFITAFYGFPYFTGLVFTSPEPPANDYRIGFKVKVPKYYQQADQWLISQGSNFRFIGFPLGFEGITYKWEKGYSGVELSSALFKNPGILYNTAVPYFYDLVPQIQPALISDENFLNLANALNVRFFFVRHDIDFAIRKMENPSEIDKVLEEKEKNREIKKVASFGQLSFWENLKWKDKTFYSAKKIITKQTPQASDLLKIDVSESEVLMGNKEFQIPNVEEIEISYQKINPAKYIVQVKNKNPFVLVFSELYNDVWQASAQGNVFKHFQANFYGNGWLINQNGQYNIIVEYLPQRLLEAGEKISLLSYLATFLVCLFLIAKSLRKK